MLYRESLEYLYGLQRFGIKLGLDNIRRLLARAGDPQNDFRLIHVAGTNGKGSVCAMLAALAQKAGHRTGLYTSPHLHAFRERIRVDGEMISEDEIAVLTNELKVLCSDDIPATFFEFTTAMALCHFRNRGVDWGVLETGMGGRLDATNAVTPVVSVITPISLDHSEHLGASMPEIALEKAGIVKPRVPVVSALQMPEVEEVLRAQAETLEAPFHLAGKDFTINKQSKGLDYSGVEARRSGLVLPLEGRHQQQNFSVALAALEMTGLLDNLSGDAINQALDEMTWPGRLEWWPGEQPILLDGAHNLAGCKVLADYLAQQQIQDVCLLFGTKADKSSQSMLAELIPYAAQVLLVEPPVEVASPLQPLRKDVLAAGLPVSIFQDVRSAVSEGVAGRNRKRTLVVAGSLFLVAAVREALMDLS